MVSPVLSAPRKGPPWGEHHSPQTSWALNLEEKVNVSSVSHTGQELAQMYVRNCSYFKPNRGKCKRGSDAGLRFAGLHEARGWQSRRQRVPTWHWAGPNYGAPKRSYMRQPLMHQVWFKTHTLSNWQLGACPRGYSPASLVFKTKNILTCLHICL